MFSVVRPLRLVGIPAVVLRIQMIVDVPNGYSPVRNFLVKSLRLTVFEQEVFSFRKSFGDFVNDGAGAGRFDGVGAVIFEEDGRGPTDLDFGPCGEERWKKATSRVAPRL